MCYHNSLKTICQPDNPKFDSVNKLPKKIETIFHVNGFTYPLWQVEILNHESGIQESKNFNWGLIPSFSRNEKEAYQIRSGTLNARMETLHEKPSFKENIEKRRCLVKSSGFFEWREYQGKKYPYFIQLKEREIFSFAGLYDCWKNPETDEIVNSFSIITTKANELMEKIHNTKKRMPAILEIGEEEAWLSKKLNGREIDNLLKPYSADKMESKTVSMLIGKRKTDTNVAEVQQEYFYKNLPNLEVKTPEQLNFGF